MKKRFILATCAFLVGLFSPSTLAGVVSVSGDISLGAMPSSLLNNALTSNSDLFLLMELQDIILPTDVSVDIQQPGSYSWFTNSALAAAAGTIVAGTTVNSYLLHFDPLSGTNRVSGIVTFAEPIVGLIVRGASFGATDAILGAPGTSYANGTYRGLESKFDGLTLSADMMSLSIDDMQSTGMMDQVRIVTANVVPEPPTVALALLGMIAIGYNRRDRAKLRDP